MTLKRLPPLKHIFSTKSKEIIVPVDAIHFFDGDKSKLDKYIEDNCWKGEAITENGYEQFYVNDWVEENTNFRRLTPEEYVKCKHQYILIEKSTLFDLVFSWPLYCRTSVGGYSCIFANKSGIELYDKFVSKDNYVCVKIHSVPWFDEQTYKVFGTISSNTMQVCLRKKRNRKYWETVSRLNEKTFQQIM